MENDLKRVLVVDDYEPWRRLVSTTLRSRSELQVIGEASDGLEAVRRAKKLQPDLVLLDIGLPTLNGIEAAQQIRQLSPKCKILFLSENRAWEIADKALRIAGSGYVVKSDAASELLPAVDAVLQGKQFISASVTGRDSSGPLNDHATETTHCHEVAFFADDISMVEAYVRFIESGLKIGNSVIVVVTEAHRASLVPRLQADGVNVATAIEQGSYFPLDAADTLSKLMVNDMPDPLRCAKVVGNLITGAGRGVKREDARVTVCGEIAPTLLSKGNAEGAIKLECLWDEITRGYGVHTLCGYSRSAFPRKESSPIFERICAEHSNYSRRLRKAN